MDLVSAALNERLNRFSVYSFVACPGVVISNMTEGRTSDILKPFVILWFLFVCNSANFVNLVQCTYVFGRFVYLYPTCVFIVRWELHRCYG